MTINEIMRCIKKINPDAVATVWDDGRIIYEAGHTGERPSLKDCEKVIAGIRAEMSTPTDEEKIEAEEKRLVREQAIASLTAKGELTAK